MSGQRSSQKKAAGVRVAQELAAAVNPLHNASLCVALLITVVVELGQPDALYWSSIILLTVNVCLVIVTTLISEIVVTIIDIAIVWWQRLTQSRQAMKPSSLLTSGGMATGMRETDLRNHLGSFKRVTAVGSNAWK